ncbi:hypothetical protein V5O48_011983 [Marasmius crinis-equi]|uniref:ARID domain-containing protein n=1 Tax=Marasmius crinis-equi TaxID=585013 RepID=A0ABR3F418_9AGAR
MVDVLTRVREFLPRVSSEQIRWENPDLTRIWDDVERSAPIIASGQGIDCESSDRRPGVRVNPPKLEPVAAYQLPNRFPAASTGDDMMGHAQVAPNGDSRPIPPLIRERFNSTYKDWCSQKCVSHDQRLLSIDGLPTDLYMLHSEVVTEGGLGPVQQKNLWAVIAARMGCVLLPGGPNDPPKSGPAAANQLAHVYKVYLADFDRVYMSSVLENRLGRKQQAFQQMLPTQLRGVSPQQMRMLVQVAETPAMDLRAKGMPEDLVHVVENNRQALQLMRRDQRMFKNMFHPAQATGPANAGGPQGGLPIGGHKGGMPGQLQFNGMPPRPMPDVGGPNNIMFPPKPSIPNLHPVSAQSAKLQAALPEIQVMKRDYMSRVTGLPPVEVSNEQRLEYNDFLEQVHRTAQDMERKLPFFHVAMMARQPDNNAGNTKKLVSFIINVQHQRTMIAYSTPRFIMSLQDLRQAQNVLNNALEYVATHWKSVAGAGPGGPTAAPNAGMLVSPRPPTQPPLNSNPVAHHTSPQGPPLPPVSHHTSPQGPPLPPVAHHTSPQGPPPPQSSPAPNNIPRPPFNLQPPPLGPKKKGSQTTPQLSAASPPNAVVNTPTPPADPTTQAANASTPTHASSPQTSKSPKSKPPAKPRPQPKPRRPSNTVQKPSVTPTAIPFTEPAQIPPPNATNGLKRPREEDESSPSSNAAAGPSSVAPGGPSPQASGQVNEPPPPKKIRSNFHSRDISMVPLD